MQKLVKDGKNIGEQHRLQHGLSNDEHHFFYEYLQISPSYQLAHRLNTGQVAPNQESSRISDWDLVLNTYAIAGDVFSVTFLQWWEVVGRNVFYTQQPDGSYSSEGPIRLMINKLNTMTLIKGPVLVCYKAVDERSTVIESNLVENWRLGVRCNIPSKWTKELKKDSKKTLDNLEARTALGVLVSKKLKEALYIAEHAARGNYPSNSKISTGLKFDGDEIFKIERNNVILFLAELKERNKVGLGYYMPAVGKKFLRKQEAEKKKNKKLNGKFS